MSPRRRLSRPIASILIPTIGVALLTYFTAHMIQGNRGLIARDHLLSEISVAEARLDILQAERESLEARANGLGPMGLDLDLLDERARAMLNLVHADDVIIFVNAD